MSGRDETQARLDARIQGLVAVHHSHLVVRQIEPGYYEVVGNENFTALPAVGYALLTASSEHRVSPRNWPVKTSGELTVALGELLGWTASRG